MKPDTCQSIRTPRVFSVMFLSDSGPLRLARTPSPPEDESPPESPDAGSNHMLRPVSPGPPRPKSPIQVAVDVA